MLEWVRQHDALVWALLAVSGATFIATLILVPMLIVRIPPDYFSKTKRRRTPWEDQHPAVRVLLILGKNLLGVVFIVAGIAMLALPGQGILTILLGLVLLDFPGKFRLERWLVRRRPVIRTIDWLRRRAGRERLALEPHAGRRPPPGAAESVEGDAGRDGASMKR